MRDNTFANYRQGYVVADVKDNKIMFKKLVATYSFDGCKGIFETKDNSNNLELSISLSPENQSDKAINYAVKSMSLILGTNLSISVKINDNRADKDDYELYVAVCCAINEMLDNPINKKQLENKLLVISGLEKAYLKEIFSAINLNYINKWPIEEDHIVLEKNSILNKLINKKETNAILLKSGDVSKLEESSNLGFVYKCHFSIEDK